MKKYFCLMTLAVMAACSYEVAEPEGQLGEGGTFGRLSVSIEQNLSDTKALTDYTTVLEDEKKVNDVAVFVFDKATGILNAYKSITDIYADCKFSLPIGEKLVHVIINGPDLASVTSLDQLNQIVDNLSESEISTSGLVMSGSKECVVQADKMSEPVVQVSRLVSRVVLQKITNNLPPQYGSMTIDCVYLGNANTVQSIAGEVSGLVNPDGYSDAAKTIPVGKDGVKGSCPGYLYREVGSTVSNKSASTSKYHMYCQPCGSEVVTSLYILATIGGNQYYYRVPLTKGVEANSTCSVEIEIVNLGASLPPDGDVQKGSISAIVTMSGWSAGEKYEVEF